jgi:hypothetical protein
MSQALTRQQLQSPALGLFKLQGLPSTLFNRTCVFSKSFLDFTEEHLLYRACLQPCVSLQLQKENRYILRLILLVGSEGVMMFSNHASLSDVQNANIWSFLLCFLHATDSNNDILFPIAWAFYPTTCQSPIRFHSWQRGCYVLCLWWMDAKKMKNALDRNYDYRGAVRALVENGANILGH